MTEEHHPRRGLRWAAVFSVTVGVAVTVVTILGGLSPTHSGSLDVTTATLEEPGRLELALDDGTSLIVPVGAVPEGTKVEAHRLEIDAAPEVPEPLGSVLTLYRFHTDPAPEAPVLIRVPIPEVEEGRVLEFRHHGPEGWMAVPVARDGEMALVWTGSTSPFAWLETDGSLLGEAQLRIDLENKIGHAREHAPPVPEFLPDPDSLTTADSSVWTEITDQVARADLTELYDELWQAGVLLDGISLQALGQANEALALADLPRAEEHLGQAQGYRLLSHRAFDGAAAVFEGDLEAGIEIADAIERESPGDVPIGLSGESPRAAAVTSWARMRAHHLVDLGRPDAEATRNLVAGAITEVLFDEIEFDELGGRTIPEWVGQQTAQEAMAFLEPLLGDTVLRKVVRETLGKVGEDAAHEIGGLLGHYAFQVWLAELGAAGYTPRPIQQPTVTIEDPEWSRVPHDESTLGGPGNQVMRAVTAWGAGVVAVGQDCLGLECVAAVWTSPDGVTWSRVPHDETIFGGPSPQRKWMWAMTVGGPGLVSVGWDCSGDDCVAAVWTSPDGATWSRAPDDGTALGGPGNQRMVAVTPGGPGLVAVGWDRPSPDTEAHAAVWTSQDGVTWSRVPHDETIFGGPEDRAMWGVIAARSLLVAVGYEGLLAGDDARAAVWTSPDGVTWSRVPHDETVFGGPYYQVMRGVTTGGEGLVAVGYDWTDEHAISPDFIAADAAVWTSPDGVTWSRVPHDETVFGGPGDQTMWAVTSGGPGLVAVGLAANAAVWTSPDGVTWSRVPHSVEVFGSRGSHDIEAVTAGGPGLVAVGRECSRDGCVAAVWVVSAG